MSDTTEHPEPAALTPAKSRCPDLDTGIVSEPGEIARDPRDTLIMKRNIDAFFQQSRKRT